MKYHFINKLAMFLMLANEQLIQPGLGKKKKNRLTAKFESISKSHTCKIL